MVSALSLVMWVVVLLIWTFKPVGTPFPTNYYLNGIWLNSRADEFAILWSTPGNIGSVTFSYAPTVLLTGLFPIWWLSPRLRRLWTMLSALSLGLFVVL